MSKVYTSPRDDALWALDPAACAVVVLSASKVTCVLLVSQFFRQHPASATTALDNTDQQGAGIEELLLCPSHAWLAWQPKYKFPGWRALTCVCLCFQFYAIPDQHLPNLIFRSPEMQTPFPLEVFTFDFNFLMFSQCPTPVINTVLCFWTPPGTAAPLPVHSNLSHVCRLLSHLLLSRLQEIAV